MFKNYRENLAVEEIMKKDYVRLLPTADLSQCIFEMLRKNRDEAIIVRDRKKEDNLNNVIGIVTKKDIGSHITAVGGNVSISAIIRKKLITISPSENARCARDTMIKNSIGRLLVVENDRLLGIVSVLELLNTFYLQVDEVESKLMSILENVHEAICFIDNKGIVLFWNKSSEKLYNVEKEKIVGKHIKDIFPNALLLKTLRNRKAYENLKHSPVEGVSTVISTMPIMIDGKFIGVVSTDKDESEVTNLSQELERQRDKLRLLENQVKTMSDSQNAFKDIIGNSKKITDAITLSKHIAKAGANILIAGESGTGKEVFARAIHKESGRTGNFVPINCSAIPINLLEGELYGYEDGVFAGTLKSGRMGKFEQANNGTLFLDEIGEMPLEMQVNLLRILQDGMVARIGSTKQTAFDVRIICATSRDLEKLMEKGEFRKDLYYRINVLTVKLPPLRERAEDIPFFIMEFIKEFSLRNKRGNMKISAGAINALSQYSWNGNVRELRNVIERLVILNQNNIIDEKDLSTEGIKTELINNMENVEFDLDKTIAEFEKNAVINALKAAKGNKVKAAEMLKINRSSLYYKIRIHGISEPVV